MYHTDVYGHTRYELVVHVAVVSNTSEIKF